MKKTAFILSVLTGIAIMALTSCIKEEEDNNGYRAEVKFTGNLDRVLTRVSGADGTKWDADDPVGIYMIKASPGTLSEGNVLADNKLYKASVGTATTFSPDDSTPLYYPLDGGSVKFVAYHPYSASVNSDYTLPVSVSNQSDLSAIDVLYAPVTAAYDRTTSAPVQLQFAHKLSKLVFTISNGTGVTEPVTNGITVSISKQQTVGTLNLTDGTVTASDGTLKTITTTGGTTVEAIVLPTTSLSGVEFTFVNNAGQSFTVPVPEGGWSGGSKYTYTVTLKGTDKEADISGSISPWNDGGTKPITGNETTAVPDGDIIKMTLNPAGLTRAAGGTVRLWLAGTGSAVIDWGDGNTNTYTLSATAASIDHIYADGANYAATITGSVTYLDCKGNQISSLDVSGNPTLTYLNCSGNMLTSLDLSSNPLLKDVKMANNSFENLKLSGNTTLTELLLDNILIKSLDVSGCTALKTLECRNSGITTLDVGGCTALETLNMYYNKLTSIDVSECTTLKMLTTWGCPLTALDLSQNRALKELYVHFCKLEELDVTHNPELTDLYCRQNLFKVLDVSKNPKLEKLSCGWNQLTSLDLNKNPLLNGLYFENTTISTIDLSKNPLLEELACYKSSLTYLALNNHPKLKRLVCYESKLRSLELGNAPLLELLYAYSNQLLGELDLSNSQRLQMVDVSGNQLEWLNVSGLLNLWTLKCKDNNMQSDALDELFDGLHYRLADYDGINYTLRDAFPEVEDEAVDYSYDTNKTVYVTGNPGPCDPYIAENKGWTVIQ